MRNEGRHAVIHVEGLVQHYGVRPVLKNIRFDVPAGQLAAVMGPNGMGKSTLLAAMGGLLTPQKGFIEIDGHRRRRTEEEELAVRRITYYLPADPWFPRVLSGREYLLAVGKIYSVDEERLLDHIDRLFLLFNLKEMEDAAISSYSTGQAKKLALAGVLVSDAKVLLLDEPFAGGLDPSGLLAARKVLKALAERQDVTVCLATPVPEFVEALAHKVLVLREGELCFDGSIEELRRQTGVEGDLEEVLERLISPQTLEHVEHYLEGTRP